MEQTDAELTTGMSKQEVIFLDYNLVMIVYDK
jgi:hypothetical protein